MVGNTAIKSCVGCKCIIVNIIGFAVFLSNPTVTRPFTIPQIDRMATTHKTDNEHDCGYIYDYYNACNYYICTLRQTGSHEAVPFMMNCCAAVFISYTAIVLAEIYYADLCYSYSRIAWTQGQNTSSPALPLFRSVDEDAALR